MTVWIHFFFFLRFFSTVKPLFRSRGGSGDKKQLPTQKFTFRESAWKLFRNFYLFSKHEAKEGKIISIQRVLKEGESKEKTLFHWNAHRKSVIKNARISNFWSEIAVVPRGFQLWRTLQRKWESSKQHWLVGGEKRDLIFKSKLYMN
jgi:hypothetical protein